MPQLLAPPALQVPQFSPRKVMKKSKIQPILIGVIAAVVLIAVAAKVQSKKGAALAADLAAAQAAELRVQQELAALQRKASHLAKGLDKESKARMRAEAEAADVKAAAETAVVCCSEREKVECSEGIDDAVRAARLDMARAVLAADANVLRGVLAKHKAVLEGEWQRELAAQPEAGILMVAGAQRYLINAFVSLWAVRRHWNSSLPVTIM